MNPVLMLLTITPLMAFPDEESGVSPASSSNQVPNVHWCEDDGDGRCDLYLVGLKGESALLRQTQSGTFERSAELAGIPTGGSFSAARWIDYDADQRLDLHLTGMLEDRLFHNDGARTIHEHALQTPQAPGFAGLSAPAGTLRTLGSPSIRSRQGGTGAYPSTT